MVATQSLYRLPATLAEELEQLRQMAEQLKAGEISAARFQAFRVPQGVYEQRENGTYMLRVRLPAGIILPEQMTAVAAVARKYGNEQLHLTSRQDIQVHRVELDNIHPALVELAEAGLSTKGGGGNTVRNIAACPLAGVCPHEVFDVTPHVIGLTERLLPDPLSYQLPRKYKIAFSGCGQDCAAATVSDLGFISKVRDGVEGFAVYTGGGMGAISRVGELLEDFIPVSDAYRVAEAVKRVFDKHGNRKNRHRARLRFLVAEIGIDAFKELYQVELDALPVAPFELPILPVSAPAAGGAAAQPIAGFAEWRKTHVYPQKQDGYVTVEIAPRLGEIDADQLTTLAGIIDRYGERTLRAANWQGAMLRWVAEEQLPALHAELSGLGLGESRLAILRRMVACAGASTCRLGICLARGLADAVTAKLEESGLDLSEGTGELSLNISGCPNSCGRHPVAQIGFSGAARRVGGHLAPHYALNLGGHVEEGLTTLATSEVTIPARNVPAFLVDFLRAFQASPQHPDFDAFLAAGGRQIAEQVAQPYLHVPDFDEDKNYYFDWGAQELFSLAGRGPGECGAGVFDLIQVDLASAAEALEAGKLFTATALAARSLLVTRGEQADNYGQALALFRTHFVEQKLVPAALHPLIERAIGAVHDADPETAFTAEAGEVGDLVAVVRKLYEDMGPSLRVAAPACGITPTATPAAPEIPADLSVDFRGVSCPLNYVKTKMSLGRINTDQVLAVLLDGEGAKNVPASAASDGHEIVSLTQDGGHWRVLIRKKA
ncbi:MAG: sulfurtransferase TusA family protein [Armatimonadota bacterium]